MEVISYLFGFMVTNKKTTEKIRHADTINWTYWFGFQILMNMVCSAWVFIALEAIEPGLSPVRVLLTGAAFVGLMQISAAQYMIGLLWDWLVLKMCKCKPTIEECQSLNLHTSLWVILQNTVGYILFIGLWLRLFLILVSNSIKVIYLRKVRKINWVATFCHPLIGSILQAVTYYLMFLAYCLYCVTLGLSTFFVYLWV